MLYYLKLQKIKHLGHQTNPFEMLFASGPLTAGSCIIAKSSLKTR